MNTLTTLDQSPIESVQKDQLAVTINRVRTMVPDGPKMTSEQLTTIAVISIQTRTLPGRDIHYWLDNNGNLKTSDDYKWLVAWATMRERYLTGNTDSTFEDVYDDLTEEQKMAEGILADDYAVYCTITTKRDRQLFRDEVKGWIDLGFDPSEAVDLAKQTLGNIGTRAIGVVKVEDVMPNKYGNNRITTGWSAGQKARKLALKNAIKAKYGAPSIDDMQQMTKQLARVETVEADWDFVIDEPPEIQAKKAELKSLAREVQEAREGKTPEENRADRQRNVDLLRGPADDAPIGEGPEEAQAALWADEQGEIKPVSHYQE